MARVQGHPFGEWERFPDEPPCIVPVNDVGVELSLEFSQLRSGFPPTTESQGHDGFIPSGGRTVLMSDCIKLSFCSRHRGIGASKQFVDSRIVEHVDLVPPSYQLQPGS